MSKKAPTTDALRERIDAGKTGDKVDYPDPAAAPLGADAEAAGAPPGPGERRTAAERVGQTPDMGRRHGRSLGLYLILAAAILIVLIILFAFLR